MVFSLTKEEKKEIDSVCSRYPARRAGILHALWMVQEREGYVSDDAMVEVAKTLDISPAAVQEVVTFYTMFERRPCARHHIQVCRTIGCWLRGSERVLDYLEKKLDIKAGEQTKDGRFKLSAVECLASCGTGPMMQVNNDYYENLTPEKVDKILDGLK